MRGSIGRDVDVMSNAGVNWADVDVLSDSPGSIGRDMWM